jgi:hypothetical protein
MSSRYSQQFKRAQSGRNESRRSNPLNPPFILVPGGFGNLETWKPGNLETWKPGNLETWKPGNLPTSKEHQLEKYRTAVRNWLGDEIQVGQLAYAADIRHTGWS